MPLPKKKITLLRMLVPILERKAKFSDICVLPDKVWTHVFSFLDPMPDLWCIIATCRNWRKLASQNDLLWTHISLRKLHNDANYSNLRSISSGDRVVERMLKAHTHKLTSVDLVGLSPAYLPLCVWTLKDTKLRFLRLPDVPPPHHKAVCDILRTSNRSLQAVDMGALRINRDLAKPLDTYPILEALKDCTMIRKLALPAGSHITAELAYCWPWIQHIDITGSTYTSHAFKVLASRVVSLTFGWANTGSFGEHILLGKNSKRLKHLSIRGGTLKDGEICYIMKNLPFLESLSLDNAKEFSVIGFRKIAEYGRNLRKLEIRFGKVDNSVILLLRSRCPKLEVLNLEGGSLNDAAFVHLLLFPSLRQLCLYQCSNLTPEGVGIYKVTEEETKKHQTNPVQLIEDRFPDTDFFDYCIEEDDDEHPISTPSTDRISEGKPLDELLPENINQEEFVL